MRIRLRLFASLAQAAGFREREIEVPDGSTAGETLALLKKGPLIGLTGAKVLYAVNREHCDATRALNDGDELGLFPPVSGGAPEPGLVLIDSAPLDAARLTASVRHPGCGAVVTFEGVVRDHAAGGAPGSVEALDYEAYPEMALRVLAEIRDEVEARHPGARLALAHRTGRLVVGEPSVVVACAAPHRRDAFAACRLAMDRIKESLPVWKSEEPPATPSKA